MPGRRIRLKQLGKQGINSGGAAEASMVIERSGHECGPNTNKTGIEDNICAGKESLLRSIVCVGMNVLQRGMC